MTLVCSTFPPSETLTPYLLNALQQYADNKEREFHTNAAECMKRVHRVKKQGPRRMPPAISEIIATETSTPMSMRIHFPGEASRMVMIDSCTLAEEVMQKASSKIHLKNPERFGLNVISSVGGCNHLLFFFLFFIFIELYGIHC